MADPVLNQSQVPAFVCECKAAEMAQHVGMDVVEARADPGLPDNVVHRLSREWLPAFGDEQPGERILPRREPSLDGPQLVPCDRLFDAEAVLQSKDPASRLVEVHIRHTNANRFGDTQPMPEHHQDQEVVPNPVAPLSSGRQKPIDVGLSKIITAADMCVCGRGAVTLDTSPVDPGSTAPENPGLIKASLVQLFTLCTLCKESASVIAADWRDGILCLFGPHGCVPNS